VICLQRFSNHCWRITPLFRLPPRCFASQPTGEALMKTAKELREEKIALCDRAQALVDLARTEGREPSQEEEQAIDEALQQSADFDPKIARAEKLEANLAAMAVKRGREVGTDGAVAQIRPVAHALAKQRHGKLNGYENREEAFRAGCWFAASFLNHAKADQYCRDMGIQQAMSTGSGSTGGFLVPEEMERAIIRLVETYGVFRASCRVMPMTSDTLTFPTRTAGVTSYYVGEVPTSITESSPTLRPNQLVAKVLAVRTLISRDLLEDAIIDVANWVTTEVALAFANAEDEAGFNGDGTSTYGGIVGCKNALAAGSKYTALTGNTAFSTLDLADFEAMVGKLPTYARANAAWYISNVGFYASMARLMHAAGGNTVVDLGRGPVLQFMGHPVKLSQVMNSTTDAQTSTTGLCYLGDLAMTATLGNRRGIETQILRELYAATRQVGIITTQRFDINVHERGTASVAGPLVTLVTPGS